MKKIESKARKFLREIFKGASFTAMAFVFQACYGPLPDDQRCEVIFTGMVVSKSTSLPVEGIKVIVGDGIVSGFTDKDGKYSLYSAFPRSSENGTSVIVSFQDSDGLANGHFEDTTVSVQCRCNEKATADVELLEIPNE